MYSSERKFTTFFECYFSYRTNGVVPLHRFLYCLQKSSDYSFAQRHVHFLKINRMQKCKCEVVSSIPSFLERHFINKFHFVFMSSVSAFHLLDSPNIFFSLSSFRAQMTQCINQFLVQGSGVVIGFSSEVRGDEPGEYQPIPEAETNISILFCFLKLFCVCVLSSKQMSWRR